ncbi:MAG: cytochrome c [Cyclobacteriaceae bacterium]
MSMTSMLKNNLILLLIAGVFLASCTADGNETGFEYAPQMYHSIPYEPLSQIDDKDAGEFVDSYDNETGEYYNSNPYNAWGMNMRLPAENTVRRTASGVLPYRIPADTVGSEYWLNYAATNMTNPLPANEDVVGDGRLLYNRYCYPCHGGAGQGDGPVGKVYKGVPAYNKGRVAEVSQGHIFHVITYGKGRMYPHGSQVSIEDRWKIARYVETLQK